MIQNLSLLAYTIIGVNILATVTGFKKESFFLKYHFQISKIRDGEYIRLITAGFLHVSTSHILFNMFTFYFFVNFVLGALGNSPFIFLYFGSLLSGNIFAYFFHYNEPNYSAVGASVAVPGVLFSSFLLYQGFDFMCFFFPFQILVFLFDLVYLFYFV